MIAITSLTGPEATLGVAVLGVVATGLNIYLSNRAKGAAERGERESRAANMAVNNVEGPKIYDLVVENHQKVDKLIERLEALALAQDKFEHRWDETPWEDGSHISRWVADREKEAKIIKKQLKEIADRCLGCDAALALKEIKERLSAIEKKMTPLGG